MSRAFIYIIIGAALWGTIGFYVKNLYAYDFTPMEVVTLRVWSASLLLLFYLSVTSPKSLILFSFFDIKYFIGTGIFSIIFFNYSMFKTMELATIPIATSLLYTAPAFVIILSYFLFQELFTKNKVLSLLATIIGSALVVGVLPFKLETVPLMTILIGLCSGFGYALYSIFSKFALQKYGSLTVTTFTFVVASITLLPFFPYEEKIGLLMEPNVLLFAFGLGFLPTAVAYIIYTFGLSEVEASTASILATIEPVVATLVGVFIFLEPFSIVQVIGMIFIIVAVILIQQDRRKTYSS